MNEDTLSTCSKLEPLGIWMYQNGIEYLGDLYQWEDNEDENWKDWKSLPLPPKFKPLYKRHKLILRPRDPVSKTTPKKAGYATLLSKIASSPRKPIWKNV